MEDKPNSPIKDKNPRRKRVTWPFQVFGIVLFAFLPSLLLKSIPESYILCSKSRKIYTVDESNPRVECISVHGSRIVDVGDFGMCCDTDFSNIWTLTCVDRINNFVYHRALSAAFPTWIVNLLHLSPKVVHVNESAVVLPGLAGE